jgi:hypothetical protein
MGKGNMLGDEDAFGMRNYTTIARCLSMNGELLAIKIVDFHSKLKCNEDTWNYIKTNAKKKEQAIIESINKSN